MRETPLRIIAGTAFLLVLAAAASRACELCAVYNALNARGEAASGPLLTIAEQFVPARTEYFQGREFVRPNPDFVDTWMTHVVPAWNFSEHFGLSLSVPVIYRSFRRREIRYGSGATTAGVERGTESGLGDIALVARWTPLRRIEADWSGAVSLLGGVKFPTGDADRLRDAVEQVLAYEAIVGPGHDHDALGTPVSGVHQHDLTLGSGSYDGIFGLTASVRRGRLFFQADAQYYLRTPGEAGYEIGDQVLVAGGPGVLVVIRDRFSLSLQAKGYYENAGRDEILGRKSNHTGLTAWYLGPFLSLTIGGHFSANLAAEFPLDISNNGFRNVPDYRVHGDLTWRF
jgi:hypothetical protein